MNKKRNQYAFVNNYLLKLFSMLILATVILGIIFIVTTFFLKYFIAPYLDRSIFYYWLLSVRDNIIIVIIVSVLVIYATIMILYLRKLTRYIDEIITVASTIHEPDVPIEMSEELEEIAHQFIQIKEEVEVNRRFAKEAERRKNDLLVYLAHDLKTPLTSIIGYLTFLNDEKELPTDIHQKYLGITKEKALRLEDLLNEFFEIARFNLTSVQLDFTRIQLDRMIEQMTYEFIPLYQQKQMTCHTKIDPNIFIMGDANKLSRAIDNLLFNAFHYSYENSDVYINLHQDDEIVTLTIINEGKTIEDSKIELLFEQFYRLDGARGTTQGGSGLGLAITKEIINAHQGSIAANSVDEKIIFTIQLPAIS